MVPFCPSKLPLCSSVAVPQRATALGQDVTNETCVLAKPHMMRVIVCPMVRADEKCG